MPFFNDLDFHALDARTTLPAYRCHGHNYLTMGLFCEALSLHPRTHSLRHRFLLRQARARRKIPKAVRRRVPRFGKSAEAVRATKTPCRPLFGGSPPQRSLHQLRRLSCGMRGSVANPAFLRA